ncbi:unnamed protein product [Calicophoron daubneyi]|uniref:Serpin domain-containing protein n=1 Tax=Calicophoron daubneyi TaxID=300641 RepID=A0AAV2TWP8_CALDB
MDEEQTVIQSLSAFAASVYAESIKGQNASSLNNLFLSPASIWIAMTMTEAGSRGDTKKEMVSSLRLPTNLLKDKVHGAIGKTMMGCFNSAPGVEVALANRIFLFQPVTIKGSFTKLLEECYQSGSETLSSLGSDEAKRVHVNEWVCDKTKGKIKELLPPGSVQRDTIMSIINTIYFRGSWMEEFDKNNTHDAAFKKLDGSTQSVKMMNVKRKFMYTKFDAFNATAVRLPFKGYNWEMLIVLTDEDAGLPNLLSHLQNPGKLEEILGTFFEEREVTMYLPRFKLGEGPALDVKKLLMSLGMKEVFDEGRADLGDMCENRLFISDVFHKAVLEVDEEGATAAAASAAMVSRCALMPLEPVTFRVDHPFFVAMVYQCSTPVFVGHVVNPEAL